MCRPSRKFISDLKAKALNLKRDVWFCIAKLHKFMAPLLKKRGGYGSREVFHPGFKIF
jgi:hypothetical protein